MADQGTTQRSYRAPCPNCGAPVEFRSAQSTHAVCSFCHSTVVREGDTLKHLGKMAELFDDFSPLQLAATGRYEQLGFTLIGRLQYGYSQGRWTEWIAALDDGQRVGVLSEDNGAYVFALPIAAQGLAVAASALSVGMTMVVGGQRYNVTSHEQVTLVSAQGELPHLPPLNQPFAMVELRSEQGQVISLDYSSDPPAIYVGRSVQLDDLSLRGLRDESAKSEHGRSFNCPHCGAPVSVQLENTQSITCTSCGSLIDISKGIGGLLRHTIQDEPLHPLIPLGSVGQLQGVSWQVVGFQRRMGRESGETFEWEEYLLYNKTKGFNFLVNASTGWSLVAPTTGVPALTGAIATYQGKIFRLESRYSAETIYVAGEFYWQVERGQVTINMDFTSGPNTLSLESSRNERVWSYGNRVDSRLVAAAFNLELDNNSSDAGLLAMDNRKIPGWVLLFVALIVIAVLMSWLDQSGSGGGSYSGGSYSGGSYGNYSSGGGHK